MDSEDNSAAIYDFIHPDHKIKSDWPVLKLISKKIATEFETKLFKQFQFPIEVSSEEVQMSKYRDTFSDIKDTKLLFESSLPPLSGDAWLSVDRALVYSLAETFFGGKGETTEVVPNPILSHTEKRLCQFFINCLQESLTAAWITILEINNPVFDRVSVEKLNQNTDDQVIVVCDFKLLIAATEYDLQMIYSYSMLEPHRKELQKISQQSTAASNGFSRALKKELMNCEIDMHAVLAETKISLAEFLELKSGDFIPLREVENVSFKTNSKPLFDARVGNSNGQVSASFSRWCVPGLS